MPKKTKKEKIIAQYRRKLSTIQETVLTPTPYIFQAKSSTSSDTAVVQPVDRAIRRDLIKTLMLAAVAIAGEVMLSKIIGK